MDEEPYDTGVANCVFVKSMITTNKQNSILEGNQEPKKSALHKIAIQTSPSVSHR